MKSSHLPHTPDGRIWFGVAFALIVLGVVTQLNEPFQQELMLTLNHAASALPDVFWGSLTVSGLGWAALILISITDRHDLGARLVLTSFIVGGAVTHSLKPWLSLPRPGEVLPLELVHFIGNPVINYHSMPSGHSLAAFCMGSLWVCLVRANQWPWWCNFCAWSVAVLIAASRIAVGAHWPADVLVGSGLGLIVGWLSWRFPFAWPARQASSFPWLAVALEATGAWCAFTFDEGMPIALIWQQALGVIAILSIILRVHTWLDKPSTKASS